MFEGATFAISDSRCLDFLKPAAPNAQKPQKSPRPEAPIPRCPIDSCLYVSSYRSGSPMSMPPIHLPDNTHPTRQPIRPISTTGPESHSKPALNSAKCVIVHVSSSQCVNRGAERERLGSANGCTPRGRYGRAGAQQLCGRCGGGSGPENVEHVRGCFLLVRFPFRVVGLRRFLWWLVGTHPLRRAFT